jgi:lysozyme
MAKLTARIAKELISHEAIVREAYLDSKNVWTWSVGITNASGHEVYPAYLDKPQSIRLCLEVYIERLKKKYIPGVDAAFAGHSLTEAQYGAALSFHFNTGAIATASWVKSWKAGKIAQARSEIMNWKKPPEIIGRRTAERDLFFDGVWSNNGKSTVYPVKKPSHKPDFAHPTSVDVSADLDALIS